MREGALDEKRIGETQPAETVEDTSEKSFEARARERVEEVRSMEKERAKTSAESFALYLFERRGGQELIEKFGARKVMQALKGVLEDGEGAEKQPNMLDLVKALEPDKTKRLSLYAELGELAERKLQSHDERYQEAHRQGPDAGKKFDAVYVHGDMADNANSLLNKKHTFASLVTLESLLGKIFAKGEKLMASDSLVQLARHQDAFETWVQELESEGAKDLPTLSEELSERSRELALRKAVAAAELKMELQQKMREMAVEAENALDEKIRPLLSELAEVTQRHVDSAEGETVVKALAEATRASIQALRASSTKRVEEQTREMKRVLAELGSIG